MTPEDIHLATSLIVAGGKVEKLLTALDMIGHGLPEGRTLDIIVHARVKLRLMAHDLISEGNYLGQHGGVRG